MASFRVVLLSWVVLVLGVSAAHAEQRRDWALENIPAGNYLYLDYFGTGGQATLERRRALYGDSNSYALNVSSLLSYPTGQVQASASVRVLFLELGGTLGYRSVWRNLSFEPGAEGAYCAACDRPSRRDRDPLFGAGPDTDHYAYAEATAALYLPLNEWLVFNSSFTAHYEDSRPRSFDQFYMNIHDSGVMLISETTLLFKHRDWGGIGPYVQVLSLPRAGRHERELAWGFNAVTRLGLIARNDVLLATLLLRPGDGSYGQHSYYGPMRAILAYRIALEL